MYLLSHEAVGIGMRSATIGTDEAKRNRITFIEEYEHHASECSNLSPPGGPDDQTPEEYEIYGNDRNRSRLFERYTEHCEHSDL
jgi:hypothetical protein